jgi:multiple sugar transport system substrate-binding protein
MRKIKLGRWPLAAIALVAAAAVGFVVGLVGGGQTTGVAAGPSATTAEVTTTEASQASGDDAVTTDADDSASDTDESSTPANGAGPCDGVIDGPVELTLTAHAASEAYTSSVESFNDGPGAELGVRVELLDLGEVAYEDFITAAGPSDDFPDIVDMDGPFLYNFAWNGYVQPLGNCVDDLPLDDFLPSILSQGTYEGDLYSLGSFDSGLGLWVKRSALESVGARVPTSAAEAWTVEEFDRILRDLAESGIAAPLDIKWWYGAGEWHPYGFAPIVQSAGGDLIDRSDFQTAAGALNGPAPVAALTRFQSWVADGLVDLEATDDTNFTEGDAAISWVGHWMYPAYSEALGADLALVPLPDFGQGSVTGMGSWNWAMSSTTEDPDAVWAFIEHVTSPEQVAVIAASEGAVPSRFTVLNADPSFQPGGDRYLYRANLEAAPEVARPRPATPAYGTIRDAFSDAFVAIVDGADVTTALNEAVAAIDQDIERNDGYGRR